MLPAAVTFSSQFVYLADDIYLQGKVDWGSAFHRRNEDIDNTANVHPDWMSAAFDARVWSPAAIVHPAPPTPVAKTTLPLHIETDVLLERTQVNSKTYFLALKTEMMAGLTLRVPENAALPPGTTVTVKMSEEKVRGQRCDHA